jgi:hypothetical protein
LYFGENIELFLKFNLWCVFLPKYLFTNFH